MLAVAANGVAKPVALCTMAVVSLAVMSLAVMSLAVVSALMVLVIRVVVPRLAVVIGPGIAKVVSMAMTMMPMPPMIAQREAIDIDMDFQVTGMGHRRGRYTHGD
jgi:hypothetical protein